MDPFSYICVLTSIVAGLAVTRIVSGFGQLLQTRARAQPYWVHTLWMANVLLTMVIAWWVQYRWRNTTQWTLFLFLWLLIGPLIIYLAAALLFPNDQEATEVRSWRDHYFANSRKVFILLALIFASDLFDTLLKGWHYFLSLGPLYYGSQSMHLMLCLIAAGVKSPVYHGAFAIFFCSTTSPCSVAICSGSCSEFVRRLIPRPILSRSTSPQRSTTASANQRRTCATPPRRTRPADQSCKS